MHTEQPTHHPAPTPTSTGPRGRRIGLAAITLALVTGAAGPATHAAPAGEPETCCASVEITEPRRGPDRVADYIGGVAARVRREDGTAVPGELFILIATVGSTASARLYDATPFTHRKGEHDDTIESNRRAVATAAELVGADVEPLELTTAPAGGPSGGLVYLMTYLNQASDGAFTGDRPIAATGELSDEGYLEPISAATEKLPAAHFAGAATLFTTSMPSTAALNSHAARVVGRQFRSRDGAVPLSVERGLEDYKSWGADAPDGLDVVVVGHVADVAAYLCGAGSTYACQVRDQLADVVTTDELTSFDLARAAHDAESSDDVVPDEPLVGGLG